MMVDRNASGNDTAADDDDDILASLLASGGKADSQRKRGGPPACIRAGIAPADSALGPASRLSVSVFLVAASGAHASITNLLADSSGPH